MSLPWFYNGQSSNGPSNAGNCFTSQRLTPSFPIIAKVSDNFETRKHVCFFHVFSLNGINFVNPGVLPGGLRKTTDCAVQSNDPPW